MFVCLSDQARAVYFLRLGGKSDVLNIVFYPNLDMYFELARLLNVDLNSCIVFEESISGVRAAVTPQIKWKEILEQYGTWRTAKDFEAVDLDWIGNGFRTK
jgi:hypothetical protein